MILMGTFFNNMRMTLLCLSAYNVIVGSSPTTCSAFSDIPAIKSINRLFAQGLPLLRNNSRALRDSLVQLHLASMLMLARLIPYSAASSF